VPARLCLEATSQILDAEQEELNIGPETN